MKIAIIGGDRRMIHAARLFENHGIDCLYFGFDEIPQNSLKEAILPSDIIVLPIPMAKEGFLNTPLFKEKIPLEEILTLAKDKIIFGGMVGKYTHITDYSVMEGFQLYNSVSTSEGALALAINHTQKTLFGMETAILGYGRIGSYLASLLKSLGARVTAIARKQETRIKAEISGITAVGFDELELQLKKAELIFNTVPATVIGHREINYINKEALIIDLASFPYGIDEDLCKEHSVKLIRASGLPGKTAVISSGEIIFKTLLSLFKERKLL